MGDDGWGRPSWQEMIIPFGFISVEGEVVSSAVSSSTSRLADEVVIVFRRTVMCKDSEQSWAQYSVLVVILCFSCLSDRHKKDGQPES